MGMHLGLIVAEASVDKLREAFFQTWPNRKLVAIEKGLPNFEAVSVWRKTHEKFVSAAEWTKNNPGTEVFVFWREGRWAVLEDLSYVLCADNDALRKISAQFGRVLSFLVETAGGTAMFECYERGELRRSISYSDGDFSTQGEPLPEESELDPTCYYMKETEQLWKAFGLATYDQATLVDCQVISVTDHTDYSGVLESSPFAKKQANENKPTKPWWKFW